MQITAPNTLVRKANAIPGDFHPWLINGQQNTRGVLNVETRVQVVFHRTELSTDPGSDLGPLGQK